jgi:3-hydroxybutyryl-CoA dehydratase
MKLAPVELEDAVRYAGAAGDWNPMHYDRGPAQAHGHPDSFAQGMLTAGLVGVVVGEKYGPERVRGFGVRFVHPLYRGEAPEIELRSQGARVEITVTAGERTVMTGWAEIEEEQQ